MTLDCKSAVLMEQSTGKVLYEYNSNESLPPASVTKVMTLLLVMEAIENGALSLEDELQTSEYASSMGGSQIFLEPGEKMTVNDLLKSVVVSSANDAAVVLAENVAGSEEAFVSKMNEKAKELNMLNTNFENVTGLDDDVQNHTTSALDIALMSRELLKHEEIFNYTTVWMDKIRDGKFGLNNTNRLIRFYNGANGLKTGSTSKAGFCISATAARDGMQLIAVIMGSPSRDVRNECAKKLLDYGFANYSVAKYEKKPTESIRALGGKTSYIDTYSEEISFLVEKGQTKNIEIKNEIPESVISPVEEGQKIGETVYYLNGNELGRGNIYASSGSMRLSFTDIVCKIAKKLLVY